MVHNLSQDWGSGHSLTRSLLAACILSVIGGGGGGYVQAQTCTDTPPTGEYIVCSELSDSNEDVTINAASVTIRTTTDYTNAIRGQHAGGDSSLDPDDPGDVSITVTGTSDLDTTGANSHGIEGIRSIPTDETRIGDISISMTGGTIDTTGTGARGIQGQNAGPAAGDVSITTNGVGITTTGIGIAGERSHAGAGNVSVSMTGGSISTSETDAHGISGERTHTGTGNVSVSMTGGSIRTSGAGSRGIHGLNTTSANNGEVSISTDGTTNAVNIITTGVGIYGERSGTGSGGVDIDMTGTGTITTSEANAHGIHGQRSGTGGGNVNIDVTGSNGISTSSAGAHGISGQRSGTGSGGNRNVFISMTGGSIGTTGAGSQGIQGQNTASADSFVRITTDNVGITTTGVGIQGERGGTGGGAVAINVTSGTIGTSEAGAHGISGQRTGSGAGAVTITVTSSDVTGGTSITTSNTGAHGIYGQQISSDTGVNNVSIDVTGASITTTAAGSRGIEGRHSNGGSVNINTDGATISTTDHGIYGYHEGFSNANIDIDVTGGSITTSEADARGIYGEHFGIGAIDIDVTGGTTINTVGATAHGIEAQPGGLNSGTTIDVTGTGTSITTTGATAHGIVTDQTSNGNTGSVTIAVKDGASIRTNARGISVIGHRGGAFDIDVTGGSTINTVGHGIAVQKPASGRGNIDIDVTGSSTITTTGTDARGIFSQYTGGGNVNIALTSSTLSTTGHGIQSQQDGASAGNVDIAVTSSSSITTSGTDARGVWGRRSGNGNGNIDIDVMGGTSITTTGHAIVAERSGTGTGNINIDVTGSSTITTTSGTDAHGVWGRRSSTGSGSTTLNVNGGTITTSGRGIWGENAGSGDLTIAVTSGTVSTTGNSNIAIEGKHTGSGGVTLNVFGNSDIDTTGSEAHGIVALQNGTGAGDRVSLGVYGDNTTIDTVGPGSMGIYGQITGGGDERGFNAVFTGNVRINSVGHGLFIERSGNGTGDIIVASSANPNITTSGVGAHGVYGLRTGAGVGNVNIDFTDTRTSGTASITTTGANSYGMFAQRQGAGNGNVTLTATDISITTTGAGMRGERTGTGAGNITFEAGGVNIQSGGPGIYGHQGSTGATNIKVDEGQGPARNPSSITTSGSNAHGIQVALPDTSTTPGTITVELFDSSSITVNGPGADGIRIGDVDDQGKVSNGVPLDANNVPDQIVRINGPVSVNNTDGAGVWLAGGGKVFIQGQGSINATSGIAILATGDRDVATKPELHVDLTLNGRRVADVLGSGWILNDGGRTTLVVNTVELHNGLTGIVEGEVAPNGAWDVSLRPAGVTADRSTNPWTISTPDASIIADRDFSTGDDFHEVQATITECTGQTVTGAISRIECVKNSASTDDISITANSVTINSRLTPILARHSGNGDVTVTVTGTSDLDTTAETGYGIVGSRQVATDATLTGDVTISMTGGTIDTTGVGSQGIYGESTGPAMGNVGITTNGVGITTKSHGIRGQRTGAGAGTVTLSVESTSISTFEANAHGIVGQRSDAGNGDVDIDVTGGTVTSRGSGIYGQRSGTGAGDVDITMTGGASITTSGPGGAHGIFGQQSGTGDLDITVTSATISTTGGEAHGIFSQQSGTGDLDITVTSATINTTGTGAQGIHGEHTSAAAGNLGMTANGAMITSSDHGIRGQRSGAGTGTVTLTVLGNTSITTSHAAAHGVFGQRNGTGDGDVTIDVTGGTTITTKGAFRHGVFGQQSGTGDVDITVTGGTISTSNELAHGIVGHRQQGNGDLTIEAESVAITTTGPASGGVQGQIDVMGTLTLTTNGLIIDTTDVGILGHHRGTGDVDIDVTGGTIDTSGSNNAPGIWGHQGGAGAGDVDIDVMGATITTTGDNARGIVGNRAGTGNGDVTIAMMNSSIGTTGIGIYGQQSGTGTMSITGSNSSIITSGENSHGIQIVLPDAPTIPGSVSAELDGGSITVNGAGADGIRIGALNDQGKVSNGVPLDANNVPDQIVRINGPVSVTNNDGAGVWLAGGGKVFIEARGSINATSGIAILATGDREQTGNNPDLTPDLHVDLTLDGRQVGDVLGNGWILNDGGVTTLVVNTVELHNASGIVPGAVAANGARDITLRATGVRVTDRTNTDPTQWVISNPAAGVVADRDFSSADFLATVVRPVVPTPTPGDPTPGDPTPGDPTPGDPTPGDPTPGDPTPGDPTPGDPAPGDPTPEPPPGMEIVETYAPRAALYEALPDFLLRLTGPGTARKCRAAPKTPVWTRFAAGQGTYRPDRSTTGATYELERFETEGGVSGSLGHNITGQVSARHVWGSADISSPNGGGMIDARGLGTTVGAAWQGPTATYATGCFSFMAYDLDIASQARGLLRNGVTGRTYTLDMEAGRRMELPWSWAKSWVVAPRVWMVGSRVDVETFTDTVRARASFDTTTRFQGGLGVLTEATRPWGKGTLAMRGSVDYERLLTGTTTQTRVSGSLLEAEATPNSLLVGLKGIYRQGQVTFGAELATRQELGSTDNEYTGFLNVGVTF